MALLIAGSFVKATPRALLWLAAVAIDYAARVVDPRAAAGAATRLRGALCRALRPVRDHLPGESIVAIGVGARTQPVSAALVASVSLGLVIAVGLWWTYFDRLAEAAEERLREHDDAVLAAADAYSYLHLVIVAGIIIFAVGINFVERAVDRPLSDAARLALCGGVALYLVGHVAFRLRLLGTVGYEKAIVAVALLVLDGLGSGLPAWAVAGAVAALLAVLCAIETTVDRRSRAEEPDQPVHAYTGSAL